MEQWFPAGITNKTGNPVRADVDALAPHGTGDDLHRFNFSGAPFTNRDFAHAAASGWKQARVPRVQPFLGQWGGIILRGIKHHLDNAFDIVTSRGGSAEFQAESAGDRRPHLVRIQFFPFDRAGFDHIGGKCSQGRLVPEVKTQRLHASQQSTLQMPNFGKQRQNLAAVPAQLGPSRPLVNIRHNLRETCGEYGIYSPQQQEVPPKLVLAKLPFVRLEWCVHACRR
jgi:hypothetical protein